ncbi:uncharacterized protein LOC127902226 [Citrus sinensis]|uniref:uncharacterized protein LOC127902226 n=1 Tax=Citrus sinensis TaxID=2711 RepID=UPI002279C927|nr:uncharacterized protein LOC127902226 [Citrus sinensis]
MVKVMTIASATVKYNGRALCDLGVSINLISLSVFKQLRVGECRPTTVTLQLTDRSHAYPEGKIEDVLMKKGELTMRVNDQQVTFNVLEATKSPDEIEDCNFISVIDLVVTERIDKCCSKEVIKAATFENKCPLVYAMLQQLSEVYDINFEQTLDVFMDDFSIFGETYNNCLPNLEDVLKRYEITNLVLNWEKWHFMVHEGIVLGHRVSKNGIEVDKAKIKMIDKLPPLTSVKGIRNFLGHAGFYRRFIKDFPKITKPLCSLLEHDKPFNSDEDCLQVFSELKKALVTTPVVIAPDCSLPFELMCDASDHSVGAVLGQRKNKIFYSIYYASKTLTNAQINYTTTEKELLAVVFAFDKFRAYLVGTKDRKGIENQVADHLSRLEADASTLTMHDITETFPDEQLLMLQHAQMLQQYGLPWYADFANYLVSGLLPHELNYQQRKMFLYDVKSYQWDEPYLYKLCSNHVIQICVSDEEIPHIPHSCHAATYGEHFGGHRTVAKVLQSGYYWPTIFKDAYEFSKCCDKCQRVGNISQRHEMPLTIFWKWRSSMYGG